MGMKPIVVKIGGSTLGNHDTTLEDLVTLQKRGVPVVVAHGGAQVSTEWLGRLKIPTSFVDGLRITDSETLKVVIAALAGLVNKELVAIIQAEGGKAIGICGVDGGLLEASIKNAELGYVGEIDRVKTEPIMAIIKANHIPVIAPVSLEWPPISSDVGYILNVNGDTAAGAIAEALSAEKLIFLTDVEGIYDSARNPVANLSSTQARNLIDSGVASGGMVPKIEACIRALSIVPVTRIINGRKPHALLKEMDGQAGGTSIIK